MENTFLEYIIDNYALLIISFGMIVTLIYNLRYHNRVNTYSFIIIIAGLLLSVVTYLGEYLKAYASLRFLDTLLITMGYMLRPAVLFLFIQLAEKPTKKGFIFSIVPLALNTLVYLFPLFLDTELGHLVFYLKVHDNATLSWVPGNLRFFSHIIAGLYLAYVFFLSIKKVRRKHAEDAFILISCASFVIIATIFESLYAVYTLVNATIAVTCVFYYLFLHNQASRKDALTGLYGRATYYNDIVRFDKQISGVIQLDMNGLKFLNDNFGHEAGDEALVTIAQIMEANAEKYMYCYRLGGDEFVMICLAGSEEDLSMTCDRIRSALLKTKYNCAIGWAHRKSKDQSFEDILKESEAYMYKDKEIFYKNNKVERRKQTM